MDAKDSHPHPHWFLFQDPVQIGDRLYAVAGGQVWIYDPVQDKWEFRRAKLQTYRVHHALAAFNGKLYAFGGLKEGPAGERYQSAVEEYDPAKGVWEKRESMPGPRRDAAAVVVGNLIYLVGGFDSTRQPLPILVYDPVHDTWQTKKTTSKAGNCWGAHLVGKRFYIFGTQEDVPDSGVLEVYAPAKDKITFKKPVPNPRTAYATAAVSGKIYVIGGHMAKFDEHANNVDVFDVAKNKWTTLAESPTPRSWAGAAVFQNKLYLMGGVHKEWSHPEDSVLMFDLAQ